MGGTRRAAQWVGWVTHGSDSALGGKEYGQRNNEHGASAPGACRPCAICCILVLPSVVHPIMIPMLANMLHFGFGSNLFRKLHAKGYIVLAAYVFLAKP